MVRGLLLALAREVKHNMGFWRKLMCWRRRRDVAADFQEHMEEFVKKPEKRGASLAILQEKLKKWNRKSELEGKLQGSDSKEEEVEATLRGQINEMEKEGTDAEDIKDLEKLQGSDAKRKSVEAAVLVHIEDLGNKVVEKDSDKENSRGRSKEKNLPKRDAEKEQMETALRGEITKLKKKIMEKDSDRATLEGKFRRRIWELEDELQETDSLKKEVESALRDQRQYYNKRQLEKNAAWEQVVFALCDILDKLAKDVEEKDRELSETKARLDCIIAEQGKLLEQTRLEKERAIKQMKELEEEVRKKDRDKKTVEANLRCEINELREKLRQTNMDK
jgi:hypothetical protein